MLAERGFEERALCRIRREAANHQVVKREYPAAAAQRLDFALYFFQDGAMDQQQLIGLRGPKCFLGPLTKLPLDGLFDFREKTHGCYSAPPIRPSSRAAATISTAAVAGYVPPYWPFSIKMENAIRRPAFP